MPEETRTSLGSQVRRYRKAAGLSGAELSERAGEGLTRSVIANLENDRKEDVTVRQLMALAAALHVPPAVLLVDVFNPGAPSPYPLPDYETGGLDVRTGQIVFEAGEKRNFELLSWIGANSFRSAYPPEHESTALAERGTTVTRAYNRAAGRFRSDSQLYYQLPEEERRDFEATLQSSAEATLMSIGAMRSAGAVVSDKAEANVHSTLAALGLTYSPPYDEV